MPNALRTLLPTFRGRAPRPTTDALIDAIHQRIVQLTLDGTTRLVPHELDPETAFLDVELENEASVVRRIGWGESTMFHPVARRYTFTPGKPVVLTLEWRQGKQPTRADEAWLRVGGSLYGRLQYLHDALHTGYTPRSALSVV